MTLTQLHTEWQDTEQYHAHINELFFSLVDSDPALKHHRDFVEKGYGFGERSFWWLWKLICEELPNTRGYPVMLEIGVYKGATLSLWKLLRPDATVYGITPLSDAGGYGLSDYRKDIEVLHDKFSQEWPSICEDYSNGDKALLMANMLRSFDCVYIDGSHEYEDVLLDLQNYAPMVKSGGYLVMDDANTDLNMPHGYFRGHGSVTEAKLKWLETQTDFEFWFSVVHISVFRKKMIKDLNIFSPEWHKNVVDKGFKYGN